MHILMVVFRTSLKDRVHDLLHRCDIKAFTEVNETVGYGQTARPKDWPSIRDQFRHLDCLGFGGCGACTQGGQAVVWRGGQTSRMAEARTSCVLVGPPNKRCSPLPDLNPCRRLSSIVSPGFFPKLL